MIAAPAGRGRHERRRRDRTDLVMGVVLVALLVVPTLVLLALLIREELRP